MLQGRFYLDFTLILGDFGRIWGQSVTNFSCIWVPLPLAPCVLPGLLFGFLQVCFLLASCLLLACFLPASYFFLACFLHASCLHPARLLLASCLLLACFFFAVLLLSCLLLACFLLACCLIPACIMLTSGLLPASFLLDSCSYQAQPTATNSTRFPFLALQVVSSK